MNAEANIGGKNYFVASVYPKYLNAYFVQYVPTSDVFRPPDLRGTRPPNVRTRGFHEVRKLTGGRSISVEFRRRVDFLHAVEYI